MDWNNPLQKKESSGGNNDGKNLYLLSLGLL